jgi:hypothetical protein
MPVDGSAPPRAIAVGDNLGIPAGWLRGSEALLFQRAPDRDRPVELLRIGMDGNVAVAGTLPPRSSSINVQPGGERLSYIAGELGWELWRMDGLHDLFGTGRPR